MQQLESAFGSPSVLAGCESAFCVILPGREPAGHLIDTPFEFGSCMKAIILAAACERIDSSQLDTEWELRLREDVRVPASEETDLLADGTPITVDTLLRLMISVSDNTATEMIWQLLGEDVIRDACFRLGIPESFSPRSVTEIYQLEDPLEQFPAFRSTTRVMSEFYGQMCRNALGLESKAIEYFWDVLHEEDARQKTSWREGIRCHRKSGSVIWDSVNGAAISGVVASKEKAVPFSFALARRPGGEDSAEADYAVFRPMFGRALKCLEEMLVAG